MQKEPSLLRLIMQDISDTVRYVGYSIYKFEYAFGMYTLTALHRVRRYLRRELRPMFGWMGHFFHHNIWGKLLELLDKFKGVGTVFREEFAKRRTPFIKQPLRAVGEWFACLFGVGRRYPFVLGRICRVIAPIIAVIGLVHTLDHWNNTTFGIQVEYDGVHVGTILDERVYHEAISMAQARVYSEDGEFSLDGTAGMQLVVTHENSMIDTAAMCDAILRTKGDAISEGSGLYVDNVFIGSMATRAELEAVLDDIKKPYLSGEENERAEFMQNVQITDGMFLTQTVMSAEQMKERLTAEAVVKKEYTVQDGDVMGIIARKLDMSLSDLRAMNPQVKNDIIREGQVLTVQRPQPFLRVKVVRTVQYTETIDYAIEKEKDNTKYTTYEKVKQKGEEGSQTVTAEITLVDGVEDSRNILSIDITKHPVSKIVIVGTKPVYANGNEVTQGDGKTTGNMLWPVPSCHSMSRGWRSGHYALDINGPGINGKPIVAADGGTVISAGWNTGGYGYLVIIQHSSGLQTWYAHCSALNVVTGQKVTRGQMIGRVGNTGYSTGPHLHFEVRKNGQRVNPIYYVNP